MEDSAPPPIVRSTRLIDTLRPDVARQARDLIRRAAAHGIQLVVTSGLRTYQEQEKLYAKGRATKGPKVTNAKPGYSWHNFGRAFDIAFWTGTTVTWDGPWKRVAELAKELGLEWGGDFKTFVDYPHFQNPGGMTLAQARYAKQQADNARRDAEKAAKREERRRLKEARRRGEH